MSEAEAYEQVPYPGLAIPQTHPDRLAVLGVLHGLAPAPPDRARVLEVGCADGLNLVAMAARVPAWRPSGSISSTRRSGEAAEEIGLARRPPSADCGARAWASFDYVIATVSTPGCRTTRARA